MDPAAQQRLTILTVLIVALMGLLIVFTGYHSVLSERYFFRRMAFDANRELARMVAREFVHVFSSQTTVIDDLARLPSTRARDLVECRAVFKVMMDHHPRFRAIQLVDPGGEPLLSALSATTPSDAHVRKLQPAEIRQLVAGRQDFLFTDAYSPGSRGLAMTYARKILTDGDELVGLLTGEFDFSFLDEILSSIQLGRTGQLIVTDRAGRTLFTSHAFDEADNKDFKAFPYARAYGTQGGLGYLQYDGEKSRLCSFARIQEVAREPSRFDEIPGRLLFPLPVVPSRIPDWMIVAQQHADEALAIADRMKYNIIALVIAGLFGAMVILKLWMDSLAD